jgi:hypothetical protein
LALWGKWHILEQNWSLLKTFFFLHGLHIFSVIKIENAHQITKRIKFDVLMDKLYPTVQDKKRIESILVMEPNSLENTMNFLYDKEKVRRGKVNNSI